MRGGAGSVAAPRTLGWVWAVAAGGVTLALCAALARGAEHPALAALGSAFWVGVGAALAALHARALGRMAAAAGTAARAPWWPALAPVLAALLPVAGAARLALQLGGTPWRALALALTAVAALTAWIAFRARARRNVPGLLVALLVAGLPATAAGLAAPVQALLAGPLDPPALLRSLYGLAFGVIPGFWCAGAWLLGRARVAPRLA